MGRELKTTDDPMSKDVASLKTIQAMGALVPKIKTPIQLAALMILGGGYLIVQSTAPNPRAFIAIGVVAVFLVLFAHVLPQMQLPAKHRGPVLVILTALFLIAVFGGLAYAAYATIVAKSRLPKLPQVSDGRMPEGINYATKADASVDASGTDPNKNRKLKWEQFVVRRQDDAGKEVFCFCPPDALICKNCVNDMAAFSAKEVSDPSWKHHPEVWPLIRDE